MFVNPEPENILKPAQTCQNILKPGKNPKTLEPRIVLRYIET